MIGLKVTSNLSPFLQLINTKEINVGQISKSKAIYQFYDMVGNPVPFHYPIGELSYLQSYAKTTVTRQDLYTIKADAGNLTVQLTNMPLGNYWIEMKYFTGETITKNVGQDPEAV